MTVELEWLGTATFRLTVDDIVVFLDAYLDRLASAPPVGLTARDVDRADYVLVGHSHFDHLAGAEVIAANTGARIIGSNETARVMLEDGAGPDRLLRVQGGPSWRMSRSIPVRRGAARCAPTVVSRQTFSFFRVPVATGMDNSEEATSSGRARTTLGATKNLARWGDHTHRPRIEWEVGSPTPLQILSFHAE